MRNFTPSVLRKAIFALIALIAPLLAKAQYCTPYSYCYSYYYCSNFTTTNALANINVTTSCSNSSSGSNSYNSSDVISAVQGTTFNFSITNGPGSYMYYSVWVDWNNDNDFYDANEDIYAGGFTWGYANMTGTVTVPTSASVGLHRIRVMASYYYPGDPCYTYYGIGETEDYDINVISACDKPTNLVASNITGNSADVNWDAVPSVLGYEYVLDQLSADPTTAGTFTATNSYGAFGLNSLSNYYLHVRTKCSPTDFSLWTKVNFSTIYNPCAFPTGITVSTPTASNATFSWSPVTGSQGYYYVVNQASTAPTVPGTFTTGTSGAVSGLTGGATYYLYVRNECSGTSKSDWNRYQFTMPECYRPGSVLTTTITDTSADFIWGVTNNANYYEYQVDPFFAPPAGGSGFSNTTGMSAHVEGLIPQTKYYVHLRARCFLADSSAWITDSLETRMGCLVPDLTVANANTNTPSVIWDAIPHAIAYEYKINNSATAPSFGTEIYTTYAPPITLAPDGKDYYIHVRAKCNSQFNMSNWNTQPLRLSGVNVAEINGDGYGISTYPNPASDVVNVRVNGLINSDASIIITDITGKLVKQVPVTTRETNVDLKSIAKGIYLLKYSDSKHSEVVKLTVE